MAPKKVLGSKLQSELVPLPINETTKKKLNTDTSQEIPRISSQKQKTTPRSTVHLTSLLQEEMPSPNTNVENYSLQNCFGSSYSIEVRAASTGGTRSEIIRESIPGDYFDEASSQFRAHPTSTSIIFPSPSTEIETKSEAPTSVKKTSSVVPSPLKRTWAFSERDSPDQYFLGRTPFSSLRKTSSLYDTPSETPLIPSIVSRNRRKKGADAMTIPRIAPEAFGNPQDIHINPRNRRIESTIDDAVSQQHIASLEPMANSSFSPTSNSPSSSQVYNETISSGSMSNGTSFSFSLSISPLSSPLPSLNQSLRTSPRFSQVPTSLLSLPTSLQDIPKSMIDEKEWNSLSSAHSPRQTQHSLRILSPRAPRSSRSFSMPTSEDSNPYQNETFGISSLSHSSTFLSPAVLAGVDKVENATPQSNASRTEASKYSGDLALSHSTSFSLDTTKESVNEGNIDKEGRDADDIWTILNPLPQQVQTPPSHSALFHSTVSNSRLVKMDSTEEIGIREEKHIKAITSVSKKRRGRTDREKLSINEENTDILEKKEITGKPTKQEKMPSRVTRQSKASFLTSPSTSPPANAAHPVSAVSATSAILTRTANVRIDRKRRNSIITKEVDTNSRSTSGSRDAQLASSSSFTTGSDPPPMKTRRLLDDSERNMDTKSSLLPVTPLRSTKITVGSQTRHTIDSPFPSSSFPLFREGAQAKEKDIDPMRDDGHEINKGTISKLRADLEARTDFRSLLSSPTIGEMSVNSDESKINNLLDSHVSPGDNLGLKARISSLQLSNLLRSLRLYQLRNEEIIKAYAIATTEIRKLRTGVTFLHQQSLQRDGLYRSARLENSAIFTFLEASINAIATRVEHSPVFNVNSTTDMNNSHEIGLIEEASKPPPSPSVVMEPSNRFSLTRSDSLSIPISSNFREELIKLASGGAQAAGIQVNPAALPAIEALDQHPKLKRFVFSLAELERSLYVKFSTLAQQHVIIELEKKALQENEMCQTLRQSLAEVSAALEEEKAKIKNLHTQLDETAKYSTDTSEALFRSKENEHLVGQLLQQTQQRFTSDLNTLRSMIVKELQGLLKDIIYEVGNDELAALLPEEATFEDDITFVVKKLKQQIRSQAREALLAKDQQIEFLEKQVLVSRAAEIDASFNRTFSQDISSTNMSSLTMDTALEEDSKLSSSQLFSQTQHTSPGGDATTNNLVEKKDDKTSHKSTESHLEVFITSVKEVHQKMKSQEMLLREAFETKSQQVSRRISRLERATSSFSTTLFDRASKKKYLETIIRDQEKTITELAEQSRMQEEAHEIEMSKVLSYVGKLKEKNNHSKEIQNNTIARLTSQLQNAELLTSAHEDLKSKLVETKYAADTRILELERILSDTLSKNVDLEITMSRLREEVEQARLEMASIIEQTSLVEMLASLANTTNKETISKASGVDAKKLKHVAMRIHEEGADIIMPLARGRSGSQGPSSNSVFPVDTTETKLPFADQNLDHLELRRKRLSISRPSHSNASQLVFQLGDTESSGHEENDMDELKEPKIDTTFDDSLDSSFSNVFNDVEDMLQRSPLFKTSYLSKVTSSPLYSNFRSSGHSSEVQKWPGKRLDFEMIENDSGSEDDDKTQ